MVMTAASTMQSLRNMVLLRSKVGRLPAAPEYAASGPRTQGNGLAERPSREQQVLPGLRLVAGGAQQVGRMVRDDQRRAAIAVHAVAKARDRRIDFEQRTRGASAERDDQRRRDELDLTIQIGPACRDLERLRRAIAGRP